MKLWRFGVLMALLLSMLVIAGSAFFFEGQWPGYDLPNPEQARYHWSALSLYDQEPWLRVGFAFAGLAANFLLAVIILFLLPRRVRRMVSRLTHSPRVLGRAFGVGLMGTVLLVGIALLAASSSYAFPAVFLLAAGYFVTVLVGMVAFSFQLGSTLLQQAGWGTGRPLLAVGLGSLLLFAGFRIPYAGLVIFFGIWILGAGLGLLTRVGSEQPWSLKPLME